MTPKQESALRRILIGVGAGLLIAMASGAWSMKESVAAHDRDIATVRAERTVIVNDLAKEQSETRALVERVLDAQCENRPTLRACRE